MLWRGGLIAAAVVLVLSTQFLFQAELYDVWQWEDIFHGWLAYFLDLAIVGACVFAALAAASRVPLGPPACHFLFLGAIALGALSGEALLLVRAPLPPDVSAPAMLAAKLARWMAFGAISYAAWVYHRRAVHAAREAHEAELQRRQLERQLLEARLQALRAQIEPHFLFNTLANVHRLHQTDRGLGRRMLADFIAYLRGALPRMRGHETTLGQELELARAYLGVLQVRMGERLAVRLDVPENLRGLPFPPLALSTLAENAVKHGLNPLPEGGSIEIAARVDGGHLRVEVADTGAGLRYSSGSGSGLANLRARLTALYGDAGTLEIRANAPRGIRATIAVPARMAHG